MSAEREPPDDPHAAVFTHTYDAQGYLLSSSEGGEVTSYSYDSGGLVRADQGHAVPPAPQGPGPQPRHVETFEFRLSASECQERRVTLDGPGPWLVAAGAVRAYLTRDGAPAAATSAIGGIEIDATVQDSQLVCRAALTDFGASDLVIVRVDVAVYSAGG